MAVNFAPQIARALATGRTATHRIPAKPGKAGAPYARIPFKMAGEYEVSVPGAQELTATLLVTGRAREPLNVTRDQARQQGYATLDDFKRSWVREHDKAWIKRHARDFAWARYTGGGTVSWILLERYRQHWHMREVWVITFERVGETRYLAQPDPVRGHGDYTRTLARAIDPLPVVDEATQARYAKVAAANRAGFLRDLEAERKKRAAATPRGLARSERGRSVRRAA